MGHYESGEKGMANLVNLGERRLYRKHNPHAEF